MIKIKDALAIADVGKDLLFRRFSYSPIIASFDITTHCTLRRKFPCVIGENAECEKCGCGGSVLNDTISRGDYTAILEHLKTHLHL